MHLVLIVVLTVHILVETENIITLISRRLERPHLRVVTHFVHLLGLHHYQLMLRHRHVAAVVRYGQCHRVRAFRLERMQPHDVFFAFAQGNSLFHTLSRNFDEQVAQLIFAVEFFFERVHALSCLVVVVHCHLFLQTIYIRRCCCRHVTNGYHFLHLCAILIRCRDMQLLRELSIIRYNKRVSKIPYNRILCPYLIHDIYLPRLAAYRHRFQARVTRRLAAYTNFLSRKSVYQVGIHIQARTQICTFFLTTDQHGRQ